MIRRALNKITYYSKCCIQTSPKMVNHKELKGHDEFTKFVDGIKKEEVYFFLFTGSKNEHGKSWCPDCVEADPVIEKALSKVPQGSNFVTVFVGDRETWKDRNCAFRKDPKTMLMVIPTLLRWQGPQRLEGEQCAKKDLVEMMFLDED